MTMLSAITGLNVPKWTSGTTYPLDAVVWSPISKLPYVRIVAGAGTTDPSADTTNWELFGPSKIKSIQRGTIALTAATSATATITSVVAAKSEVRILGWSNSTNSSSTHMQAHVRVALTGSPTSTTVTATAGGASFVGTTTVSFEVTEWW